MNTANDHIDKSTGTRKMGAQEGREDHRNMCNIRAQSHTHKHTYTYTHHYTWEGVEGGGAQG